MSKKALALETRLGSQIENEMDPEPLPAGSVAEAQDMKAKYPACIHRQTEVTAAYNCHGLTFAARRTQIFDPSAVRMILKEDGYHQVAASAEVSAGDIVIYVDRPTGDITHSGIVVERGAGLPSIPKILSKWGACHEVVHPVNFNPYMPASIEYWRIVR